MSDILRQVDEELRQDRLLNLWRKYRLYLIFTIILVIGSVLGYQINHSISKSSHEDMVEKYIGISDLIDIDDSIKKLDEINDSNSLYISDISKIKIANLFIEKGNKEESRNKLLEIINNNKSESSLVDLATYFYLMSNLKNIEFEEMKNYLTKEKMKNSSFKFLYKEIFAIKYLLSGDIETSSEKFNASAKFLDNGLK